MGHHQASFRQSSLKVHSIMSRVWHRSFFLLALGCGASLFQAQMPKPHPGLKTLMFYTCVTKEVENQCEESFTLDQRESANMGFTANFTTIRQGYEVGIRSLFAVHDIFFNNTNHSLNTNWRSMWEDTKAKLTPYINGNQVAGFFIGDELFPGKIPLSDFSYGAKSCGSVSRHVSRQITTYLGERRRHRLGLLRQEQVRWQVTGRVGCFFY